MVNKNIVVFIVAISLVFIFTVIGTVVFFNVFKVTKIEVTKNFDIDNNKLVKYLGIKLNKFIFSYNLNDVGNRIERLPNIREFSIKRRLPDTLIIEVYRIIPVARIIYNSEILYVDQSGKVLEKLNIKDDIPLIIADRKFDSNETIENDEMINNVIDILWKLKNENKKIYNSILKITIREKNKPYPEYYVNYSMIDSNIYLKKLINVDLLREGYAVSLYIKENNYSPDKIRYNTVGYAF